MSRNVSEKGKNWDGELLTETNLHSGVKVINNNKIYETGNRRNNQVELYTLNILVKIVSMRTINLIKLKSHKTTLTICK